MDISDVLFGEQPAGGIETLVCAASPPQRAMTMPAIVFMRICTNLSRHLFFSEHIQTQAYLCKFAYINR